MTALAAIAALLAASGIITVVREFRPAPPRLDAALARIQSTPLGHPSSSPAASSEERIGKWLVEHLARPAGILALPRADLAILDRTVERFMLDKLILLITGLVTPSIFFSLVTLVGGNPSWPIPVIVSLAIAMLLSFAPDWGVRAQARQHRKDFRYAFSAYLQLVVIEREAGSALNSALEEPAKTTDGWAFQRIHQALTRARHAQQQPWGALARLGEDIGVGDLIDLAHTAEIAGSEGAKMHDVLVAKVSSMRREASAAARSEANTRTTTMWVPTSLLMLGFVILVGFPFFSKLMGSG